MQERQYCSGNIQASHACAPGLTPGWRMLFSKITHTHTLIEGTACTVGVFGYMAI